AAPEDARCDVVVSNPGQQVVRRRSEAAGLGGLRWNAGPWGGINLGDEATSVVLINLSGPQLEAELRRPFPDQPSPAAVGELAAWFLRACSDYPPVRLILGPGEGYRLPQGG